jgi:hypothetical protein
MTTSSFDFEMEALRERWNKERPRSGPNPGRWIFNRELRVIVHKPNACKRCNAWLGHFLESIQKGDSSLEEARDALDTVPSVQRDVDNARQERDEAVQNLARVRRELETARDALKQARQDRAANKDLHTECEINGLINRLCDDLKVAYHNSPAAKVLPREQDMVAQVEEENRGSKTRTTAGTTRAGQPPPPSGFPGLSLVYYPCHSPY